MEATLLTFSAWMLVPLARIGMTGPVTHTCNKAHERSIIDSWRSKMQMLPALTACAMGMHIAVPHALSRPIGPKGVSSCAPS